jgi:hypothetical protein
MITITNGSARLPLTAMLIFAKSNVILAFANTFVN